ncbi:IclR family transcriptional regulator [Bacillus sp. DTU_2020_1000418_1_SI_GHA_SEK_038]|uniref:IclR family transcriptional regulator n=1 Tax=Bacillus sp. DTU_2020_1000418_1_SI_GHA_SEK_038 TaxID=3077585 RepID=UPI0028EB3A82|nr:IclR family transcriptional regulator [Bacillus sp. DTU_2020_1000418_1_SI_GHA_SEK_038]WNS76571.1 IclR family transcriptional regulator [Bacillus sp. DTU_2020_1000418_1_SI_GHA_SEK_038]
MQSIDRAMHIVKVLIQHYPNQFSITELAKECKLPTSSLHRNLNAMIKHEMIQQDPKSKLYGLGNLWLEYGLIVYDTLDYVSVLRPELENLMRTVEATVYLSKPIGTESIIIERIDCIHQTIRVHDKLGLRTPLHEGAANLTMLAHMTTDFVGKVVNESVPEAERTAFFQRLNKIKIDGYELLHDEQNDGISFIASPILNHYGGVIGAVSIKLNISNMEDETLKGIIDEVINTGNKISWKMGHSS